MGSDYRCPASRGEETKRIILETDSGPGVRRACHIRVVWDWWPGGQSAGLISLVAWGRVVLCGQRFPEQEIMLEFLRHDLHQESGDVQHCRQGQTKQGIFHAFPSRSICMERDDHFALEVTDP